MDYIILSFILIVALTIFTIYKAKKNDVNIVKNINGIIFYSLLTSGSIILALALIYYAMTGNMILGLTDDIIRPVIFSSGMTILFIQVFDLKAKFDPEETKNNEDE